MKNGKIAFFSIREGRRRLKTAPGVRLAWFARERSARAERSLHRYRSMSARRWREYGWYRGRFAFRPCMGTEGFFAALAANCRPIPFILLNHIHIKEFYR